jgi:hypothetical protein
MNYKKTEKVVFKPLVKFKANNIEKYKKTNTIMPSYEIIIKRNYTEFDKVWDECKRLLYKHSRDCMEKLQKTIKLRLGVDFAIFKLKPYNPDDIDFLNDDDEPVPIVNKYSPFNIMFLRKDDTTHI